MNQTFKILGFTEIIERLTELAASPNAREMLQNLQPYLSESELRKNIRDTSQARQMLDQIGTPPIPAMEMIEELINKAVRGELLIPEEIEQIAGFLAAVQRMKRYLERGQEIQNPLGYYSDNLLIMNALREELERCVRNGKVDDYASPLLGDLRRNLIVCGEKIKTKAEGLLRSQKKYMAESFIVTRNGRICLPVKKEYKSKIPGIAVDSSATGATVFIEPEQLVRLREEKDILEIEEDSEVRRILYTLMDQIAEQETEFFENLKLLWKLDFIFAKGKLSADMQASEPAINTDGYICLEAARHPALAAEDCVPLDFTLGKDQQGIVITGPNTGGKTVAIKTVGLLSLMAGSGLHVPCEKADICMQNQVLCDIGDGQNIVDNLSTFSAHIRNVLEILQKVTPETLVILDELGSGTDPAEGMGIAVSVLEELRKSGCLFLATTHYPEIKSYASEHTEILNARMAFDRENLRPLYQLELGKSGESCALYIAKKLGMPGFMLNLAAKKAYGQVSGSLIDELGLHQEEKRIIPKVRTGVLKRIQQPTVHEHIPRFTRGDSVMVMPEGLIGIVVNPEDDKGIVLVQIKNEKRLVNHTRLKLKVAAAQLYPEDYDFSIIFDSVENRKARHQMGKKHQPEMEIHLEC